MSQGGSRLSAAWLVGVSLASCASPAPPPAAPPPPAVEEHHHEPHLPPVGPTVRVTVDGKSTDVAMASLAHEGTSARLADLLRAASAGTDLAPYHFDLTGSDGFHPASRQPCARPLGAAEVLAARINVVTHDVSYDPPLTLPGCYRVKAVVAIDASR